MRLLGGLTEAKWIKFSVLIYSTKLKRLKRPFRIGGCISKNSDPMTLTAKINYLVVHAADI